MLLTCYQIGMAIGRLFNRANVIAEHAKPAPVAEGKASTVALGCLNLANTTVEQQIPAAIEDAFKAVEKALEAVFDGRENDSYMQKFVSTYGKPMFTEYYIRATQAAGSDEALFAYYQSLFEHTPPELRDAYTSVLRVISNSLQSAFPLEKLTEIKRPLGLANASVQQQASAIAKEKASTIEESTNVADATILEQIPVVVPENEPVVEKALYRAKAPGEWKRRESPQKEDPKGEQSTLNGISETKADEARIITISETLARPLKSQRKEAVPATREEVGISNLGDIAKYCPGSVLRPLQDCHLEGCTMPKLCWEVLDCGQEHSLEFSHALQKILPLSFHANTCNVASHGINRNQWDNVAWSIRWDIYSLVKAHEAGRYNGTLIKDPASVEDQETTFEEVKNDLSVLPEWKQALVDDFWAEVKRKGQQMEGFKLADEDTLRKKTSQVVSRFNGVRLCTF